MIYRTPLLTSVVNNSTHNHNSSSLQNLSSINHLTTSSSHHDQNWVEELRIPRDAVDSCDDNQPYPINLSLNYKNLPFIDTDCATIETSPNCLCNGSSDLESLEKILDPCCKASVTLATCQNLTDMDPIDLSMFTDESPTHSQPVLITVRIKPGEQGRFGFNVKGGADQNLPVLVSRVAPNTPADLAMPRLNEGDQVMSINGIDVEGLTHDHVVRLIRSTKDTNPDGELVMTINPLLYSKEIQNDSISSDEPAFQYIPVDASPSFKLKARSDRLHQSIMLLREGLESGAIICQFDDLYKKKPGELTSIAKLPHNECKNRYRDISPYDSTRVILKDSPLGDYVNASFVNLEISGSKIINRYIATQGPLSGTCEDFWQMIWEQNCSLIVMVTPLIERGRTKCSKYWPDIDYTENYGDKLSVTCVEEKGISPMIERTLCLSHISRDESRNIIHIQYLAWPDHGVPEDATEFLDLIDKVRKHRPTNDTPIIVHCSAGIGRTGVLMLMETMMCLIEANEPVYPLEILKLMRDQRAMLIQTSNQFKFALEAILKIYKEGLIGPKSSVKPS